MPATDGRTGGQAAPRFLTAVITTSRHFQSHSWFWQPKFTASMVGYSDVEEKGVGPCDIGPRLVVKWGDTFYLDGAHMLM